MRVCAMGLLLTLAACRAGPDEPRLIVDVRTDLVPALEFNRIRVTVDGARAQTREAREPGLDWVSGARLGTWTVTKDQLIRAEVEASLGATLVLSRSVVATATRVTGVTVTLTRSCRETECGPQRSCLEGRCVPLECAEGTEEACGGGCADVSSCPALGGCVRASCQRSVCLQLSSDAVCGEAMRCHPAQGCVPSSPDGGGMDAGIQEEMTTDAGIPVEMTTDAGIDASTDARSDAGPPPAAGATSLLTAAAGFEHSCVVRSSGGVACFGSDSIGDTPIGVLGGSMNGSEPVEVADLSDAVEVVAGWSFSCGRNRAGDVRCWGWNPDGQLGNAARNSGSDAPVDTLVPEPARALVAGHQHGCALGESGQLYCWGTNDDGELGIGFTTGRGRSTPEPVLTLTGVRSASASNRATCAVDGARVGYCWGSNGTGRLGAGAEDPVPAPRAVEGLGPVSMIDVGSNHACALELDGRVVCWGANTSGQLGDGGPDRTEPRRVVGVEDAVSVTVGSAHSCALRSDGSVLCWGRLDMLGRGEGETVASPEPALVDVPVPLDALDSQAWHTVARDREGGFWCWGANDSLRCSMAGDDTSRPTLSPDLE